jgi:hypothetical protein
MINLLKIFFAFSILVLSFLFANCSQPTAQIGEKGPKGDSAAATGDTSWHEVGSAGNPTFIPGWGNTSTSTYSTCAFRKDNEGYVHLKGSVTGPNNITIFSLPQGYWPSKTLFIGSADNYIKISQFGGSVLGYMVPNPSTQTVFTFYLDSIVFYAEL